MKSNPGLLSSKEIACRLVVKEQLIHFPVSEPLLVQGLEVFLGIPVSFFVFKFVMIVVFCHWFALDEEMFFSYLNVSHRNFVYGLKI